MGTSASAALPAPIQGHRAHTETPFPWDHHRDLGIGPVQGGKGENRVRVLDRLKEQRSKVRVQERHLIKVQGLILQLSASGELDPLA